MAAVLGSRSVPRYFFHLIDNGTEIADPTGMEMGSLAAANLFGLTLLAGVIASSGTDAHRWVLQIKDSSGVELARVNWVQHRSAVDDSSTENSPFTPN